ncbi:hypothetical protein [Rhodovulum steppense]|uniref:Uncharacterized protein n=1 Tax=Rhodovulum steppense TaxID=540251 RepID=A0A4R1YU87_9RHOB|nr:hypothetical protein [Rhodovulum steppense]TCM84417.1 hypothetical protein EV216_11254 [Rhodovulum steppense]
MHDPQYEEFRDRLARLDRMHRQGYGFEAPGTLGRSFYRRRAHDGVPVWRVIGMIALCMLMVKALILMQIGPDAYGAHLDRAAGDGIVQKVTVFVMQIDPITDWLAGEMRRVLGLFG